MDDKFEIPRATLEDILISRDEDGNVLPIEVKSDLLGRTLLLKPMSYSYVKRHGIEMDVPAVQWDTNLKLDCIKTHIVDPDFSEVTVQDIEENTDPMTINHFIAMIIVHSVPFFRIHQDRGIPNLAEKMKAVLSGSASQTPNTSSTN